MEPIGIKVTPKLIMIVLSYTQGNMISRVNLKAFTLVKPLNVAGMRVGRGLEVEFLHRAYGCDVGTTLTINH